MPLVNHAFARVTPATFVIFVVFTGLSSKTLVLQVRTRIRHFRRFRQNTLFMQGAEARFTKGTIYFRDPDIMLF